MSSGSPRDRTLELGLVRTKVRARAQVIGMFELSARSRFAARGVGIPIRSDPGSRGHTAAPPRRPEASCLEFPAQDLSSSLLHRADKRHQVSMDHYTGGHMARTTRNSALPLIMRA